MNRMNRMQIVNPSKSILILDDEFDIVNVVKQGIDKRGFRVFAFTDENILTQIRS